MPTGNQMDRKKAREIGDTGYKLLVKELQKR